MKIDLKNLPSASATGRRYIDKHDRSDSAGKEAKRVNDLQSADEFQSKIENEIEKYGMQSLTIEDIFQTIKQQCNNATFCKLNNGKIIMDSNDIEKLKRLISTFALLFTDCTSINMANTSTQREEKKENKESNENKSCFSHLTMDKYDVSKSYMSALVTRNQEKSKSISKQKQLCIKKGSNDVMSLPKQDGTKKVDIFLDGLGNGNQFRYQLILDNAFGLKDAADDIKHTYWDKQHEKLKSFIRQKLKTGNNDNDNDMKQGSSSIEYTVYGVEREDFKKLDRLSITEYLEKEENNPLLKTDELTEIDAGWDLENEYDSEDSTKGTECCVFVKQSTKSKLISKYIKIEFKNNGQTCIWSPSSNDVNSIDWTKEYQSLKKHVCGEFRIESMESLTLTIVEDFDDDNNEDNDNDGIGNQESFTSDDLRSEWIYLMDDESAHYMIIRASLHRPNLIVY